MTRNFLQLAQSQNRAVWKDWPAGPADKYTAAIEARADRTQTIFLAERRERLEAAIRECAEHPSLFWNYRLFAGLKRSFGSTEEAVSAVLYEINWEWSRRSYDRDLARHEMLEKEALLFARYFRRFSGQLWTRRAA